MNEENTSNETPAPAPVQNNVIRDVVKGMIRLGAKAIDSDENSARMQALHGSRLMTAENGDMAVRSVSLVFEGHKCVIDNLDDTDVEALHGAEFNGKISIAQNTLRTVQTTGDEPVDLVIGVCQIVDGSIAKRMKIAPKLSIV